MSETSETPTQSSRQQYPEKEFSNNGASNLERQLMNRWSLMAAGGALGLYALTRRTKTSTAVAAVGLFALTEVGLQARQPGSGPNATPHKAHASFAINCSPEKAYSFWHDFENLPRFMQHLDSVKQMGDNRSEWTALGPMNTKFRWTSEITEDRPNERIAWRSVEGSEVDTNGSIEFRPAENGRGTLVTVKMEYLPPGGAFGKAFASMMGKNPAFTVREDLRRFKALLETGEVPTTAGQTHGPRGLSGRAREVLMRERQNMPQPQAQSQVRRAG